MSNDRIARVHYFPQQFLRTEDFDAEQAYHLEMRRRHNIAHHVWGVVSGLQLVSEEDGLFLQPGMAVDGFGRELILPERFRIPLSKFDANDADRLDVWLLYNRRGSDQAPTRFSRCDPESQAAFYRWQELPDVDLKLPDPNYPNPRRPKEVAEAGIESAPFQRPPDDPKVRWPVFLGRVLRDRSNPDAPVYSVDVLGRPVAGLVGDVVVSPSQRALVIVGDTLRAEAAQATEGEATADSVQQSGRFSVALKHGVEGQLTEHLRIQGPGEIDVFGSTRLHGNLTVAGGSINFQTLLNSVGELPNCGASNLAGGASEDQSFIRQATGDFLCETAGAQAEDQRVFLDKPWSIYRHRCLRDADGPSGGQEQVEQLRLQIGPLTDSSVDRSELVIGAWSPDDETFKPILTVDNSSDNGRVIVHGDLAVRGDIAREVAPAASRLSPEAQSFLTGTFSSGVGGANLQLPQFYRSPFGDEFNVCDDEVQQSIVDTLITDTDCMSRFVEKLLATPAGRTAVGERLEAEPSYWTDVVSPALSAVSAVSRNALVDSVLVDLNGRVATGGNLAANPSRLGETLAPVMADTAARTALVETVLVDPAGRASTGDNLTTNTARISDTLAPVMADSAARAALVETVLIDPAGQTTTGDNLVANTARISDTLAPVMADTAARTALVETVLVDSAGQVSTGDNLATNTARISDTLAPVMADTAARTTLVETVLVDPAGQASTGDNLATNTTRISDTLAPVMADTAARTALVETVLVDPAGQASTGGNLATNTTRISDTLAPVMADTAARTALVETVLVDPAGQVSTGENLVGDTTRIGGTLAPVMADTAARTALVETVLVDPAGQASTGENLAGDTTRISPTLAPVMADTAARTELVDVVLVDADGRTSTGANLVVNPGRWADVVSPALIDIDAGSRNELAAQIMTVDISTNGQVAVADFLEPSPASDAPRAAFVALINTPPYPTLKGDICATCP